jgi:hypothetical protein
MLLHFPAVPASMTQANVVDTARTPEILRDIVKPLEAMERQTLAWSASAPASRGMEVFRSGIYTIVLASDAGDIPGALDRVPPRKRRPLNRILFEWYAARFPVGRSRSDVDHWVVLSSPLMEDGVRRPAQRRRSGDRRALPAAQGDREALRRRADAERRLRRRSRRCAPGLDLGRTGHSRGRLVRRRGT